MFSRVLTDFQAESHLTLPPECPASLVFQRSSPAFCLLGQFDNYSIQILDANLYVNKLTLSPTSLVKHNQLLSSRGAQYSGLRFEIRMRTVTDGELVVDHTPFSGTLPRRVYLAMVTTAAMEGDIQTNPFNFQMFNLASIEFLVNDLSVPCAAPVVFD